MMSEPGARLEQFNIIIDGGGKKNMKSKAYSVKVKNICSALGQVEEQFDLLKSIAQVPVEFTASQLMRGDIEEL